MTVVQTCKAGAPAKLRDHGPLPCLGTSEFPRTLFLGFSVTRVRLPPCVLVFLYAVEAARPAVSCARPELGQMPKRGAGGGAYTMVKFRSDNATRLLVVAGLALLVGLITASTAQAVETRSGDTVVIGPDEVVDDDLYVTANNVVIDGTIRGDLVAFGQSITVDGTVEGDLIAAGRSVEIRGMVEDDARIAGQ